MNEVQKLKEEIEKLKARNLRVDANKAWETSLLRKVSVAVLTYIVVTIFFLISGVQKPFLNALVPTIGFLLSTMTLDILKSKWLQSRK